MNALEHVEKLKADRRAELAAAEAARKCSEREAEELKVAAWERGVAEALKELGEEWLFPFRSPDKDRASFDSNSRTFREAAFYVPGHRAIVMRIEDVSYHHEYKWRAWPLAQSNWMATWAVVNGSAVEGFPTLGDALIAAETPMGEPIPF